MFSLFPVLASEHILQWEKPLSEIPYSALTLFHVVVFYVLQCSAQMEQLASGHLMSAMTK